MQNGIFRQESMDQVNSPEMMKDYLRVTSPRLWMVLVACLALLGGFIAYSSVARNEITIPVRVKAETVQYSEKKTIEADFEINPAERDTYRTGMQVRFAGMEAEISYFLETKDSTLAVAVAENPKTTIEDGEYDAVVVVESSTPISGLLE